MTITRALRKRLNVEKIDHHISFSCADIFEVAASQEATEGYGCEPLSQATRTNAAHAVMHAADHIARSQPNRDGSMDVTFKDQSGVSIGADGSIMRWQGVKPDSKNKMSGNDVDRVEKALEEHYIAKFRSESRMALEDMRPDAGREQPERGIGLAD